MDDTSDRGFEHVELAQRASFGAGDAAGRLADVLARERSVRPMLIASPGMERRAEQLMGPLPSLRFREVVEHVPAGLAERARAAVASTRADLLVAIGGGATVGVAKAICLSIPLPVVAIPTTLAGSEATPIWGLTDAGVKQTGRDPRVLPGTVIYDADLIESLPRDVVVASGLNAVAHAVDALWAPSADPISSLLALHALRVLANALREVTQHPRPALARGRAQYGAYLAARAFGSAGSGLHHKICHVLGGMSALHHAPTHAVMLPWVAEFNLQAEPALAAQIGSALDAPDGPTGIRRLVGDLGAPTSLRELGMPEADIARAAQAIAAAPPAGNPRALDIAALEGLLRSAWSGHDEGDRP